MPQIIKCDKCDREAVVRDITRANGKLVERCLCAEHAAEEGIEVGTKTDLQEVLTKLVSTHPEIAEARARIRASSPACPNCGVTFAEFRQTGLLGCPGCYGAFETLLSPLLERAHEGGTHHVGKQPARLHAGARTGAQDPDASLAQRRGELERRLEQALQAEQYERAAAIRDEMRRLGAPESPQPAPGPEPALEAERARAPWMAGRGESWDVVLSSRVRLARNLAAFPFTSRAAPEDRLHVMDLCRERIEALAPAPRWIDIRQASKLERGVLAERHLMSQQHSKGKGGGRDEPRAVAVGWTGDRLSVMVNEEDHIRAQIILPGLALGEALAQVDGVDDRLEAGLDYAFSPRFGYLTACPTNVGTATRLSVMLHLPGLRLAGELDKVKRAASDMSLAVRGFYGEGSEASGDLYQLSNQTTLGKSELMLLHEIQAEILPRIIAYERDARRRLVADRRRWLDDAVGRAMGILSRACLMEVNEAMALLSMVRLGVVLEVLPGVDLGLVHELILLAQPAHLQVEVGQELTQDQRREARADLLRRRLAG